MKYILKILIFIILGLVLPGIVFSQITVKTDDGRKIKLYDNGTWEYDNSIITSNVPYTYENNTLTTIQENGTNTKRKVLFSFRKEYYDTIKESIAFKEWVEKTFDNPENAGFIEKHKEWDKVILYVDRWIWYTANCQRYKLKNWNSFDFVVDSEGYIIAKDEELRISFYFTGQNGYGNTITNQVSNTTSLLNHEPSLDSCISF